MAHSRHPGLNGRCGSSSRRSAPGTGWLYPTHCSLPYSGEADVYEDRFSAYKQPFAQPSSAAPASSTSLLSVGARLTQFRPSANRYKGELNRLPKAQPGLRASREMLLTPYLRLAPRAFSEMNAYASLATTDSTRSPADSMLER